MHIQELLLDSAKLFVQSHISHESEELLSACSHILLILATVLHSMMSKMDADDQEAELSFVFRLLLEILDAKCEDAQVRLKIKKMIFQHPIIRSFFLNSSSQFSEICEQVTNCILIISLINIIFFN
jgi:hypothetical protein